jgi:uncharacterized SAM-binding protein YcdF (DUF218 family)
VSLLITKLLPSFFYPLGASIVVLGATAAFCRYRVRLLLLLAIGLLWIPATPIAARWASFVLESRYPARTIASLPNSDAVVLLGGIFGRTANPEEPDLGDAGDRILEAWRLYKAGKAPAILISAGNLPWSRRKRAEAADIAAFLIELGVPRSALVLDDKSQNTRENAMNSAAIMRERGWTTAILVTSGTHMPRAMAEFRAQGVELTAAATDLHGEQSAATSVLELTPDAGALSQTTACIKEWLGMAALKLRQWTSSDRR